MCNMCCPSVSSVPVSVPCQVDLEAEELGLLNRCFESRSQFFKCCGKFHVPVVGGIRPSPGCFKKDKRHRRTKSLLDPYRRAYKRCCDEPLLRHRQMLRKVNPHTEGAITRFSMPIRRSTSSKMIPCGCQASSYTISGQQA